MSNRKSSAKMSIKAMKTKKRRQQRNIMVGTIVVVGLLFILLIVFINTRPVGEVNIPDELPFPQANLNAMGDPNAPIKMVEYSDFQCPFCKRFSDETEKQIIENYIKTGKVYFVYVPYGPGGNYIGPESKAAAQAAFCAGDQNKFWEFKDILFANHTGENVGDYTAKRLEAFAQAINLNITEWSDCIKSGKYDSKLEDGIREGRLKQVGGTPTILLNDGAVVIVGAEPYASVSSKIDSLLNQGQ